MKLNKNTKNYINSILLGNKAFIILIVLGAALSFITPLFLTTDNLFNVLRQITVSALVSIGFTLVLGSGHMDLSIGALVGFLGIILAKIMVADVPIWVAIIICILAGLLCGAFTSTLITAFALPPFIVTLAMQQVYKGAGYLITNMVPVYDLPDDFLVIGQGYIGPVPIPVYIMLALTLVMSVVVNRSVFGRHAIAMGGNMEATRVSGIDTNKVRMGVYMVAGLCAALGSIVITSRSASAQITAGHGMEMDAIAAVVIGGTPMKGGSANVVGTLFGCLIVGVVNNGLNLLGIDSNWQVIAKGLLILFAVILDTVSTKFYENLKKKQSLSNL